MAEQLTEEQKKAAADKAAADKAAADKAAADKAAADKAAALELDYHQFCTLHHLMYDEATGKYLKKKLTESAAKRYDKLEKLMKDIPGKKAKACKTIHCRSTMKVVKLVEGVALPKTIIDSIKSDKEKKAVQAYF
jgi:hypothetical protein